MIPDDELARMRRDAEIDGIRARAEMLAGHRSGYEPEPLADGRGALWSLLKLLMAHNWEADVLALLGALAAERARADAAEARVREMEDGPMREQADLGQEMGMGYGSDFANPMIRPDPAELARLRQADVRDRWVAGPGGPDDPPIPAIG